MHIIAKRLTVASLAAIALASVRVGPSAAADIPAAPQAEIPQPPPAYRPGPPVQQPYAYPPAYAYPPVYEYAPPPVVVVPRPYYFGGIYGPAYRPWGFRGYGPYIARGYGRPWGHRGW
jgi:hypothetical protein